MKYFNYCLLAAILVSSFLCRTPSRAQSAFPGEHWMMLADPGNAGWSETALEEAAFLADSVGSAAFLLVHKGKVVTAWGDVTRRYMLHSVRKSILSAMYGIYVDQGVIDPDQTLAELGIDDKDTLTAEEKQATIRDMLKARSGVYHPAAYETASMAAQRPARGSHPHNTFWYYNNWDFNTLGAIFRQQTGKDIFEAIDTHIAQPIGMEDYDPDHGYYHLEEWNSRYPAYPIRMSARDMARFGLLFARNGEWAGKSLIPASWVEESTTSWSEVTTRTLINGYAYMWWVADSPVEGQKVFHASGTGGQIIFVIPGLDMVFVHRTDTYKGRSVALSSIYRILEILLDGKTGEQPEDASVKPLTKTEAQPAYKMTANPDRYTGHYVYPNGLSIKVSENAGELNLTSNMNGTFQMIPSGEDAFITEDEQGEIYFHKDPDSDSLILVNDELFLRVGFYLLEQGEPEKAMPYFRLCREYFESPDALIGMGLIRKQAKDTTAAVTYFKEALKLNPRLHEFTMEVLLLTGDSYVPNIPMDTYMGEYQYGPSSLTVYQEKAQLYAKGSTLNNPLTPVEKDVFLMSNPNGGVVQLRFERTSNKEITGFIIDTGSQYIPFERMR